MPENKRGRVIVVGSSNTDLVVHCDNLPAPGETVLGKDMLTFAGGKGANQAVAAARAGAKVHFIGAFGDDAFGRARRADLEREGIDCSGCVVKKGVPSGVALIGIGRGAGNLKAENLIIVAPGANARLTRADVKRGMPKKLGKNDVLLCSLEIPMDAVIAAMKAGARNGPKTILNPAPFPSKGLPRELYAHCGLITPNETEFLTMSGTEILEFGPDKFRKAFAGPRNDFTIIVTRGASGVATTNYQEPVFKFAAPKVKPIDTVGAGDCFNGCLAAHYAIDSKPGLERRIRFAVCGASLKVTRQGAQAGMPYRHEILKMLKQM